MTDPLIGIDYKEIIGQLPILESCSSYQNVTRIIYYFCIKLCPDKWKHLRKHYTSHFDKNNCNLAENTERWYLGRHLHREDGPAFIRDTQYGLEMQYYFKGRLHREDGPSQIRYDQTLLNPFDILLPFDEKYILSIVYHRHGSVHREKGPAFIGIFGGKYLGRDQFSGIILDEQYYKNNKFHREDGPAWIKYDKNGDIVSKQYYINGKRRNSDFTHKTN